MVSIVRKAALWAAVSTSVLLAPHAVLAETIFGAMAKAYANNPDLNAARAGLRATDESVPIAKSGFRPQVAAFASGVQALQRHRFLSTW